MKKKNLLCGIALTVLAALTGCGTAPDVSEKYNENSLANIDTSKYMTLGNYKGLNANVDPIQEVTDSAVQNYIEGNYLYNAMVSTEVTDRGAQYGDIVTYDSIGTLDGVEIDGCCSEEGAPWSVELGSGTMIPGYEDEFIGIKAGETKTFDITFPESYPHSPNLENQVVTFTVNIISVTESEYPELTDEVVASLGLEYQTADSLRAAARKELEDAANDEYDYNVRMELIDSFVSGCTFAEEPDFLVNPYMDILKGEVEYYSQMFGMELADFLEQYYGMTEDAYNEQVRKSAEIACQQNMALEALADAEGLSGLTEEELKGEASKYIIETGEYDSVEALLAEIAEEDFRNYVISQRAIDYLMENAVVTTGDK